VRVPRNASSGKMEFFSPRLEMRSNSLFEKRLMCLLQVILLFIFLPLFSTSPRTLAAVELLPGSVSPFPFFFPIGEGASLFAPQLPTGIS